MMVVYIYTIDLFSVIFYYIIFYRCTGEQHLTFQGIDYSSWGLWHNHIALTVMTLIFLIIAYIKLRFIPNFS